MRNLLMISAATALILSPALAQENNGHSGNMAMAGGKSTLPAACEEAAGQMAGMDMSQMMSGMQNMMANMDEVQKANMDAMMKMHDPMMRAMMIKDPDLAFNCGMIAHHQGAIAMAQVELQMGNDEESKKMAQMIIDAQEKEIAEMTAWVEEHAKR
jgi:uncharacterized protein (DUF305 family)